MLPKIQKLINNTRAIFKIDSKPTEGSNNLVTSGGVYEALKSNCNSAVIMLNNDWESQTFPTRLENVTDSIIPELQSYTSAYKEYALQLPLIYIIVSQQSGDCNVYSCVLKSVNNPAGGEKFTWEPTEEAPFTKIEARCGLGASSWQWLIYTE